LAGTFSTVQAKALLRPAPLLLEQGRSVDDYLARLGVPRGDLRDPELRIPVDTLRRAWVIVEEMTNDPLATIRVILHTEPAYYGLLGHLLANSTDVETGLARLARYLLLWTDAMRVEVVRLGDSVELRQTYVDPRDAATQLDLLALPTVFRIFDGLTSNRFLLDRAGFRHSDPAAAELASSLYRCPIEFAVPHNFIRFDAANLHLRFPNADAFLSRELTKIAEDALRKMHRGDALTEHARSAVADALKGGDSSIVVVARRLAMSPRSLQRKLRERDLTFQRLLDQVRSDLAKEYLVRSGLSADEVGLMVGYAETRAFHRAFHRWTGITPVQFARAHRG
jgi:AraC-like DNA-binding protein